MMSEEQVQSMLERQHNVVTGMEEEGCDFWEAVKKTAEQMSVESSTVEEAFGSHLKERYSRYKKAKEQGLTSTAGL